MVAMSEERLEELRVKFGKIGVVDFAGHHLVFRKPTREHVREYRRKQEEPAEKVDAMDQLAQVTLVAFDGEEDANRARTIFTGTFLEAYPAATSNPKFINVLSVLSGIRELEDDEDLGKGVSVRSAPRPPSPPA